MSNSVEKVKAKFVVQSVQKFKEQEVVEAYPVTTGSEENKSFSKYTPGGSLKLHISNESLFGWFKPGEELYIDITKA